MTGITGDIDTTTIATVGTIEMKIVGATGTLTVTANIGGTGIITTTTTRVAAS